MIGRAVIQGFALGLLALVAGTVHALLRPVQTLDSPSPPSAGPSAQAPRASPPAPGTGGSTPAGLGPSHPVTPPAPAPAPTARDDRMITLARFKELMSGSLPLQIVDAREPAEFAAGHVPGAVNIPPDAFGGGAVPEVVNTRLSRDLPIVVYCSGGNCDASKLVAMRLINLGFTQTSVYEDGYTGWTKAGEATEK
ncbi:MAG: rhodanese-like domain-containing protein [Phycisphaerales bacterium]|nr:rhodanese-like domain-containing protein [Phycisphaerales bacterium]